MKSRSVTLTRLSHLNLDPKRARKAYNKMMLHALSGKSNYEGLSDAEMDAILLEHYFDLEK
jgi:hypothetical protein